MTRDEHLVFCKKCLNRSFDSKQGVICKLTGKIADFEDSCKDYALDETVTEIILPEEKTHTEAVADLSDEVKENYRKHQHLGYALIGGFVLSIICALLWAVITVSTEYQIGFMAIGVGIIVGVGVRFFGAGIEPIYGVIGAFYALLGCVLGNLFSQIGFTAHAESLSYLQVWSLLDFDTITSIFTETFAGMDLLFYGIAIVEGYKFAFRPIVSVEDEKELSPANSKWRLPLVIVSLLIISFAAFKLTRGIDGKQEYFYDSGKLLSTGSYADSELDGTWTYYYENGETQAIAEYDKGLEQGTWKWFYEDGTLMRTGTYNKGMFDGLWLDYYGSGAIRDSSRYANGRLAGLSAVYYENGQQMRRGEYKRDREDGFWTEYYDNGQKRAEGSFDAGFQTGVWHYWKQNGQALQELDYLGRDRFKVINTYDENGDPVVENGNGTYKSFFEDNTLHITGLVKDGYKTGTWMEYYADGSKKEEGIYENDMFKIINRWTAEGDLQISNGEGDYTSYYDGTEHLQQEGELKNGLKEGPWISYYPESNGVMQVVDYKNGKMDGRITVYYDNGATYTQGTHKNGLKEGEWLYNYESGRLQCTATYINDKKEGVQPFYSESGKKNKEEFYEKGEFVSEKVY